jgi:hypothetical protein
MVVSSLFSLLDFSGVAAGAFGCALETKRNEQWQGACGG